MAKVVRKIEAAAPAPVKLKRVAAYARVSMETERLNHSLSAQVSYYSELIQKHPGWVYAGVYADDGISGTKVNRPEFQKMLAECEAGNIDIVLTKSISRFARNTVDLLETVRHLKELGIEVQFEKEHISSLSDDGELMLSLLASFAQEESRSISDNVKWGQRKRMEQGIPPGHFRVYGYHWEGDTLVPTPEEAVEAHRINDLHKAGRDAELPYEGMMLTTVVAEAGRMVRLEHGPAFFPMIFSALKIGNIALIGVPGEPFNGIGRALKEAAGWDLVIPCCLTNGSEGYFPMEDAYAEGGYEARSSNFKAGVAEKIIAEGQDILAGLRK